MFDINIRIFKAIKITLYVLTKIILKNLAHFGLLAATNESHIDR